jgi:hypothetical protein
MTTTKIMQAPDNPIRKRWPRRLLLLSASSALAVALWHGIPMPARWLSAWTDALLEDRAVSLQMGGAVVSLLPAPRIRLINAELNSSITGQPLARAGLLTLKLEIKPGSGRWLSLHTLSVKEAEIWIDQTGAEGSNWSAWPRVPPRSDRKLRLPQHVYLENSFIYLQTETIGTLSARIDQLRLLQDGSGPSTLAMRLQNPHISGNLQASAQITADDTDFRMHNIQSDFVGRFAGFPWSLTSAAHAIEKSDRNAFDPWKVSDLRIYAKRDDDPDEHQAVFSAASASLHPSDGRTRFLFAEWTYTHEKAEAWSFNAELDAALGTLKLWPATIAGGEALPAKPLDLSIRCKTGPDSGSLAAPAASQARSKRVWIWQEGWFFWADEKAAGSETRTLACTLPEPQ